MASQFKKVIPTFNRVLVKLVKPSLKTSSGLILTGSVPALKWGKVIAVGPGSIEGGKLQPVDLKVGS